MSNNAYYGEIKNDQTKKVKKVLFKQNENLLEHASNNLWVTSKNNRGPNSRKSHQNKEKIFLIYDRQKGRKI